MATNCVDILKLEVDKSICRLKTEWEENEFKITLFLETLKTYYTHITQEFLRKLAEERAENVIDYYRNIKKYLLHPDSSILFDIQAGSNATNVEFVIKQITGDRTILLFSATLCQIEFHKSVFTIIDGLFEENKGLSIRLEVSKEQQAELEKEKQLCQEKLAEFVDLKTSWEHEMYCDFIFILHEKKKRIKFLTDLLRRKNNSIDKLEERYAASNVMSTKPPSPKKLETISDSSSEYDTDRESNIDRESNTDRESNNSNDDDFEPRTSTSKQTLQMDEEEPPLLCLPKISKKLKEKQLPQKITLNQDLTATILNKNSQSTQGTLTQEPYLSTQERIDRI